MRVQGKWRKMAFTDKSCQLWAKMRNPIKYANIGLSPWMASCFGYCVAGCVKLSMKGILLVVSLSLRLVSALTSVEVKFVVDFLRFLPRYNCALVGDPSGLQHFMRRFISSSYVPVRNVPEFLLHQERYTTERIVLVVTGHDLTTYGMIFDELPQLSVISRVTWITVLNTTLDLSLLRGRVRIPYSGEFFLAEPNGDDAFTVREIFSERNAPEIYSNPYGGWSFRHGMDALRRNLFTRKKNLEGYPMTVLTLQKNCPAVVDCSLREIWFDLATYLNITTRLSTVDEHMFLEGSEDLPWDVYLEPMTYDAYTFSTKAIAPIWKLTVFMHVKHESNLQFSWSTYFSLMWSPAFFYFLLWVACLTTWLSIFEYLQGSRLRKRRFHATNGIFTALYWICNQGGIYMEPNFSLLLVIIMVRIVVLVIQIFGMGTLVSLLALTIPHYPFYGPRDFLKDGTYKLATINGSLSKLYFELSPMMEEQELFRKFVPFEEMPTSLVEAMEKLCADGKFVALADNNDLMALREKKCHILRIPQPVATIFCGIALNDDSPFEFVLNSAFTRFLEAGIIEKMRRRVYEELREDKESHLHPVDFLQVSELKERNSSSLAANLRDTRD